MTTNNGTLRMKMRVYHRYLGFFLAGIMSIYALSGIVLIFRTTDNFKVEKQFEKQLDPAIDMESLGRELRIRDFKVDSEEGDIVYFESGQFDKSSGLATYTKMELPLVLDKLTHLHKATTNDPLFFLNIFFGISLLFFVVSAFWMFLPGTDVFIKGLYFAIGGVVFAILMILL